MRVAQHSRPQLCMLNSEQDGDRICGTNEKIGMGKEERIDDQIVPEDPFH